MNFLFDRLPRLLRRLLGTQTKQDRIDALLARYPVALTHDFTRPSWGHALHAKIGDGYPCHCTPRIQVGDRVRIGHELFIVFHVKASMDPPDMAFIRFWKLADLPASAEGCAQTEYCVADSKDPWLHASACPLSKEQR